MGNYILICDDDEGVIDIASIVLKEKGYDVQVCKDSDSLIEMVTLKRPDLLLLDLWMPGLNGEQITIELKSNKDTKNIPILIVSANKDIEKVAKFSGADDFLPKPFDIEVLENKVENLLKK
jgi:DNA-binding response OmpR family regulator